MLAPVPAQPFWVLSQPTNLQSLHPDLQHPLPHEHHLMHVAALQLVAPASARAQRFASCHNPHSSTRICASTTILCFPTLTSCACSYASTAVLGSVAAHQLVVTASQFTAPASPRAPPYARRRALTCSTRIWASTTILPLAAIHIPAPASARAPPSCCCRNPTLRIRGYRSTHPMFLFSVNLLVAVAQVSSETPH